MRIATLLPSATEIVCALGARSELVGVSHECDFPTEVRGLPVLTTTRLRTGSFAAIDHDVRTLVREALALYEVDDRALAEAAPDVIVTQDLCDVCAVSFETVASAVETLGKSPRIVRLHPTRLADVWSDVREVAAAIGREDTLSSVLQARVAAIAAKVPRTRKRVLTIEWIDPVMVGGLWMPELVELAGGEAMVARAGEHAPTLSREALAELSPAFVLVKPCGFSLAHTLEQRDAILAALPLERWNARVVAADGNAFFNRSGPRLVESLELLAGALHPREMAEEARKYADFVRVLVD
jgi:iron complex transport system substrate-binding protein